MANATVDMSEKDKKKEKRRRLEHVSVKEYVEREGGPEGHLLHHWQAACGGVALPGAAQEARPGGAVPGGPHRRVRVAAADVHDKGGPHPQAHQGARCLCQKSILFVMRYYILLIYISSRNV